MGQNCEVVFNFFWPLHSLGQRRTRARKGGIGARTPTDHNGAHHSRTASPRQPAGGKKTFTGGRLFWGKGEREPALEALGRAPPTDHNGAHHSHQASPRQPKRGNERKKNLPKRAKLFQGVNGGSHEDGIGARNPHRPRRRAPQPNDGTRPSTTSGQKNGLKQKHGLLN